MLYLARKSQIFDPPLSPRYFDIWGTNPDFSADFKN